MAISQTAEGCIKQYETHLGEIVTMVLAHYRDNHPRVRYAAIHCTAQLATDFAVSLKLRRVGRKEFLVDIEKI